jgi:hypothetical protein
VATTVTVTAKKVSVITGRPIKFQAQVSPNVDGKTKTTGTVTWTVTGVDGSTVTCDPATSLFTVTKSGRASCGIDAATLAGASAPYTATATYSGDDTFEGSSGSFSEGVSPANSHAKLSFEEPPANGAATTVDVNVTGGAATGLITGQATFSVDAFTFKGVKAINCDGDKLYNIQTLTDGTESATASCTLEAGWLTLPAVTNQDKNPKAFYSIVATISSTSTLSFTTVTARKTGHIKSA